MSAVDFTYVGSLSLCASSIKTRDDIEFILVWI